MAQKGFNYDSEPLMLMVTTIKNAMDALTWYRWHMVLKSYVMEKKASYFLYSFKKIKVKIDDKNSMETKGMGSVLLYL